MAISKACQGVASGVCLSGARSGGDWADRLLNGCDYPLPGLMPLYAPEQLAAQGLLNAGSVAPLTAIRRHNSLLFDFVLKRHLRLDGQGLADGIFATQDFFGAASLLVPRGNIFVG